MIENSINRRMPILPSNREENVLDEMERIKSFIVRQPVEQVLTSNIGCSEILAKVVLQLLGR
jgi:hypothetical protein